MQNTVTRKKPKENVFVWIAIALSVICIFLFLAKNVEVDRARLSRYYDIEVEHSKFNVFSLTKLADGNTEFVIFPLVAIAGLIGTVLLFLFDHPKLTLITTTIALIGVALNGSFLDSLGYEFQYNKTAVFFQVIILFLVYILAFIVRKSNKKQKA